MKDPIFNEDDIKNFFSDQKSESDQAQIRVEFQPEVPQHNNSGINTINQDIQRYNPTQPPARLEKSKTIKPRSSFSIVLRGIVRYVGIFVLTFIISFSIINAQAIIQKMRYFWQTEYHTQNWVDNTPVNTHPAITESRLIISKIGVDAPITWNVSSDGINAALENGVAGYSGTAMPGRIGNIFITGHSSYYIWAPGSYKSVFALLDNLDLGDKIYIQYEGNTYAYSVTGRVTVSPDDLNVLDQGNTRTLSLMTCVPVGTTLRRLVITANQL